MAAEGEGEGVLKPDQSMEWQLWPLSVGNPIKVVSEEGAGLSRGPGAGLAGDVTALCLLVLAWGAWVVVSGDELVLSREAVAGVHVKPESREGAVNVKSALSVTLPREERQGLSRSRPPPTCVARCVACTAR